MQQNRFIFQFSYNTQILKPNRPNYSITRETLRYWLNIPFVFSRKNWDVDKASIYRKVRESFL